MLKTRWKNVETTRTRHEAMTVSKLIRRWTNGYVSKINRTGSN